MAINRHRKLLNALLGLITASFLLLTVFILLDPIPKIDREFSKEVQEHSNHFLDILMKDISWAGYMPNSGIIVGGAALLFLIFKLRREAIYTLLTAASGLISTAVKFMVGRPRPLSSLVHVMEKTQQQSFPSGHVLFYTVFFGFIMLTMFRLRHLPQILRVGLSGLCLLLIVMIPLSRIYLGAHWFTDVTAGFLLGILYLYVLAYFYLKLEIKKDVMN